MQSVWPPSPGEPDLESIYAYPEDLARPWVQVNFVSSADGAVEIDATSAGLSHAADREVFLLGRDLCDVVLVGAGTARAENYRGVRTGAKHVERRRRLGLQDVPPIAVLTKTADLDPASRLFTDTHVPPIIITTATADTTGLDAEVIRVGDLSEALEKLADRGLCRIDCEGGPGLFADLIAEDLVDQLCLTVAPLLTGGGAGRIAAGPPSPPRRMELASILTDEGYTFLRYRRRR